MPIREALIIEAGGERFHSTTTWRSPKCCTSPCGMARLPDAIRTFFEGEQQPWDVARQRFETATDMHGLYWTRHPHDGSVIVITRFHREEE